jgi:RhtB (resistance to homoserine/threonine) family protein
MLTEFFTIGILMLLSAMLPGPDFAMVTKNSVLHSRRAGVFTALGVGSANLIHMTYCALGLAIVISQSIFLFNLVKYIGAVYLIYLGINLLLSKPTNIAEDSNSRTAHKKDLSAFKAYRQGFLCNLLNPKATMFFLALFTLIIKPDTSILWEIIFVIEMLVIIIGWFCSLAFLLSYPPILRKLNQVEKYISKILGVCLTGFGFVLAMVKN